MKWSEEELAQQMKLDDEFARDLDRQTKLKDDELARLKHELARQMKLKNEEHARQMKLKDDELARQKKMFDFEDLACFKHLKFSESSDSHIPRYKALLDNLTDLVDLFKPPDDKKYDASSDASRPSIAATGCLGADFHGENAHLCPFSSNCNIEWKPFVRPPSYSNDSFDLAFHGYLKGNRRQPHSGLIHNVINFVRFSNQKRCYDDMTEIIFLPAFENIDDVFKWRGGGYPFYILASDVQVLWSCGINHKLVGKNVSAIGFGGVKYERVRWSDPSLRNSLNVLDQIFRSVLNYVRDDKLEIQQDKRQNHPKIELCSLFRQFISETDTPITSSLNPAEAEDIYVLRGNFASIDIVGPKHKAAKEGEFSASNFCPLPLLLYLRAVNALVGHIHKNSLWPAWSNFVSEKADGRESRFRDTSLVLLPSCRDVKGGNCVDCKASLIIEGGIVGSTALHHDLALKVLREDAADAIDGDVRVLLDLESQDIEESTDDWEHQLD